MGDRYGVGVATVKYWVIDAGALHEADGDEPGQYRDLANLAYHLAVGDGVLRARYDTVAKTAHMDAVGRIESVDPEAGLATVEWHPADFEIVPGPNGRRHWEQKPYFILNAKRARAYELPSKDGSRRWTFRQGLSTSCNGKTSTRSVKPSMLNVVRKGLPANLTETSPSCIGSFRLITREPNRIYTVSTPTNAFTANGSPLMTTMWHGSCPSTGSKAF